MAKYLESVCRGLPPELCEQLFKEQHFVKIRLDKRKFGKEVTVVEGINADHHELKELASKLKSKLATGGTVKEGRIELQGDHRYRVKELLINELGFPEENVMILD